VSGSDDFSTTAPPGTSSSSLASPGGPHGQIIGGRFEILALIGSGGMGNVYRARDVELGEVVALKMLHRETVGSPERLERFRQEVRLARRVTHPNVARVFDIGEHGDQRFLTMEFIDGESLASPLRREKQMTVERVRELLLPVCYGLAAAHQADVVHRDLKPDNVLLSRSGRVVITDFGIARMSATAAELLEAPPAAHGPITGAGRMLGTPAYMAPEQVEGKALDARADIYALGVMLFQMLTGELPWKAENLMGLMVRRLLAPPPDPRTVKADIPARTAELVLRCMARDPAERPSATLVARQLDESASEPALLPAFRDVSSVRTVTPRDLVAGVVADLAHGLPPSHTALAVLPFRNAGQPGDEHWADGLCDDLIETLSLLDRLKVRSRGAVMAYKGSALDPREIGRALGVQAVVEGSLRRRDSALRVVVRLVSVADGFQIWAERLDAADGDLPALADRIGRAIAATLALRAQPPGRMPWTDAQAFDLYLRARADYARVEGASVERAGQLIAQALARVPDDPRLLSADSMIRTRLWSTGVRRDPVDYQQALAAASRAKALAPDLAEPHMAAAVLHMQRLEVEPVVAELRAALRKNPRLADAHDYVARMLIECDRIDEGCAIFERSTALETTAESLHIELGRAAALKGHWERAWQHLNLCPPGDVRATALHARLLVWQRRSDEAEAFLKARIAAPVTASTHAAMFEGQLPGRGEPDPLRLRRDSFLLQLRTEVLASRGQLEEALDLLMKLSGLGIFDIAWVDRLPLFAPLRDEARWRDQFTAARAFILARAWQVRESLLAP
jgi:serine/threonine-protein kinase